jgi:hypothetical protein
MLIPMKYLRFSLRDLFWLTVVGAVFAFGYRDRIALQRIGDKEQRLDFAIERYKSLEVKRDKDLRKTLQEAQVAHEKAIQHSADEQKRYRDELLTRLVEAEEKLAQAEKKLQDKESTLTHPRRVGADSSTPR